MGTVGSEDGNHCDALALLENLFPLATAIRCSQPHTYYDYMNSLAVELCEVGRLEEATTEENRARLKELEKLTTREKLLRIMNVIGDERVGDDLLFRALIILEGLEPDENQGS